MDKEMQAVINQARDIDLDVLAINEEERWFLAWDPVEGAALIFQDHWDRNEFEEIAASILMEDMLDFGDMCQVDHVTWDILAINKGGDRAFLKLRMYDSGGGM